MARVTLTKEPAMPLPAADILSLAAGALTASVAPRAGGSLASFTANEQVMMRQAPDVRSTDPLTMACYPLLPFVGRVAYGHFTFEGREVRMAPHPISTPHALHGLGWQRAWEVADAKPAQVRLTLHHDGDQAGWPWSFDAEQMFTLDETSLTIRIAITNRAGAAMPAGVGLHPFFPDRLSARMKGELPMIWESGADGLPTNRAEVTAVRNFSKGLRIAPLTLDHCFSGGKGPLDIHWENKTYGLRIHGREAGHTVVYTPQQEEFFCVEPVTIVPNAMNRQEGADVTGLVALAPAATLALTCRFEVLGL